MILMNIKSLENSAELNTAFPTIGTMIGDAYEILGL